jgi:hypothetical protein
VHFSTPHRMPLIILMMIFAASAFAYPSLFESRCISCHSDDSPTCNGCHEHKGTLIATADQDSYLPGEAVGIVLNGGHQSGWIRARLYDESDLLIDLKTGPTGTGDDGGGGDVVFPVGLSGFAPSEPGTYIWEAAWFGSNNSGTGHLESRRNVVINVESDGTGIAVGDTEATSWEALKALYE